MTLFFLRPLGLVGNPPACRFAYVATGLMADSFACWDLGTFARVWLARLKDQKDKNTVYALKILRKADGEHGLAP